jgi:putative flippase GtrA
MPSSLLKFLLVGSVNTLVGVSAIYLLKWLLEASDGGANAGGYLVGLTASFTLNRRWTFRHVGALLPAAARFIAVFAVAYVANLCTVRRLFDWDQRILGSSHGSLPYTTLLSGTGIVFR